MPTMKLEISWIYMPWGIVAKNMAPYFIQILYKLLDIFHLIFAIRPFILLRVPDISFMAPRALAYYTLMKTFVSIHIYTVVRRKGICAQGRRTSMALSVLQKHWNWLLPGLQKKARISKASSCTCMKN